MKRKWLAVGISVIVIILIILNSLSNVIGYQSVKSTRVNDSPLFKTRTQRATNQQHKIITSNYLGKGINVILIPLRNNRTLLMQNVVELILKLDDKEFNRLQNLILSPFYKEKSIKNTDYNALLTLLKRRYNQKELDINQYNIISNKINRKPTYGCGIPTLDYDPLLYCLFWLIEVLLIGIFDNLIYLLRILFTIDPHHCQYR